MNCWLQAKPFLRYVTTSFDRCVSPALSPLQMKTRAESLDADLDLLKMAFSEISRLASEVAGENTLADQVRSASP